MSTIFIAATDMFLCILAVVIVSVAPTHAKQDGVKNARQLISADWATALDSDVDLWVVGPSRKPTFYGAKSNDCATLDRDSLGYSTSLITLADGSVTRQDSNKETISLRCLAPGHWDVGVNLYSDRELDRGANGIPVHVEITALNPAVSTLFAKDVVLDRTGQTINVISFDMSADGSITLVPTPLELITDAYKKGTP